VMSSTRPRKRPGDVFDPAAYAARLAFHVSLN
jgi:hypothetical protein